MWRSFPHPQVLLLYCCLSVFVSTSRTSLASPGKYGLAC